jgi:hypothetical protein
MKLQRLVDDVAKLVGLPTNLARRSAKYLLRTRPSLDKFPENIDFHVFEVEKVGLALVFSVRITINFSEFALQVYLLVHEDFGDGSYRFIRKRTMLTKESNIRGAVYQLTEVRPSGRGEMVEVKRMITAREYRASFNARDHSRHIIRQERISFLYEHQSFTIHMFDNPLYGLCILHAQVETSDNDDSVVMLPHFLDVDRRLLGRDDEQRYGSYALSVISNIEETK